MGIRQLPGVCWYSAKGTAGERAVKQGGTASVRIRPSLTNCQGRAFLHFVPEKRRSFHVLSHVGRRPEPWPPPDLTGRFRWPGSCSVTSLTPIRPAHPPARDNHCFLLESAADQEGWGRWTFLGFEPELEITAKDGVVQLRDGERTSQPHSAPGGGPAADSIRTQKPQDPRPAPLHRRTGGLLLL